MFIDISDRYNSKCYIFRTNGYIMLNQLYHQSTFTEKIQIRAYTIDDVVGTVGGYVGLFMGYAIVQFPDMIRSILYLAKRRLVNTEQVIMLSK